MRKIFSVIVLSLCLCALAGAQDVITRTDGTDIKAKVTEVLPDVVKYKKFTYLAGSQQYGVKLEVSPFIAPVYTPKGLQPSAGLSLALKF